MKTPEHHALLQMLQARFARHPRRHPAISWSEVEARLLSRPGALVALQAMEATGGEPDVTGRDDQGGFTFCDCSAESPSGRRSLCYDEAALLWRKEHRPVNSAVSLAAEMAIELLTEQQYRELQNLGEFDARTSSWIRTPAAVRALGGALFCDRRYGQVFTYHNGAQSYYAARGFRGSLRI